MCSSVYRACALVRLRATRGHAAVCRRSRQTQRPGWPVPSRETRGGRSWHVRAAELQLWELQ